jgi:hypothetical protein
VDDLAAVAEVIIGQSLQPLDLPPDKGAAAYVVIERGSRGAHRGLRA